MNLHHLAGDPPCVIERGILKRHQREQQNLLPPELIRDLERKAVATNLELTHREVRTDQAVNPPSMIRGTRHEPTGYAALKYPLESIVAVMLPPFGVTTNG